MEIQNLKELTIDDIRKSKDEWLTVKDTAEAKNVSIQTVLNWIRNDSYEARSLLGSLIVVKRKE